MNAKTQHFVCVPQFGICGHYGSQGKFVLEILAWCEMAFKIKHLYVQSCDVCLVFMEM